MNAPHPDPALKVLKPRDMELGPQPGPAAPQPFRNWRLARDADNVLWAVLDKAGSSANVLSQEVLDELDRLIGEVEQSRPKALVIRSAKAAGFVAGADIREFGVLTNTPAVIDVISRGNAILDRLEALTIPTIAVVHGYCLGGGLELALACNVRIAVQGASFGFPEVQLGLHPGLGGAVRSPRLIDPIEAMSAMLTGRNLHDRKAKALGLVDALVPERHVLAAVKAAANGELGHPRQKLLDRLKDSAPARRIAARQMRAEAEKRAPSAYYPAPYALIDLWEAHGGDPAAMKRGETASFAKLLVGSTAQNLIRVFLLREKLKGLAGKATAPVRHVHVIGAGAMGGDIAAWCAWRGLNVTLGDVKAEPLGGAVKRAASLFERLAHRDGVKRRDAMDRLVPDLKGEGIARADLVIEAVPEIIELKRKIYAAAESKMKPGAILATNTSSIPLETLCEGLAQPERLVGLHFFNPVSRMQLVEVVRHDKLDPAVEAAARAFVGRIDRLPAPARSAPGFIVNRALTPYMVEALVLLDEGVKPEAIDKAAEDFGMPMGPIELTDQVGLDIAVDVSDMLRRDLGWALPEPPGWLRDKVERGELGRKTGQGFYRWVDGKVVKTPAPRTARSRDGEPAAPADLADRLILPMLNTCVTLLREGVAEDADVIDAAMIFGSGFAPFRGGPLHYAKTRGAETIKARLQALAGRYGERFAPDPGWDTLG